MKYPFFTLFLFFFLQIHCSKNNEAPQAKFELEGTFNNEPFNFSSDDVLGNSLSFGTSTNSVTGEILYIQRSAFGNPIAGSRGISFLFSFDEKLSIEMLENLGGQELFENDFTTRPNLRINAFNDNIQIMSEPGTNTDDTFEIEAVKVAENEFSDNKLAHAGQLTGSGIALKGNFKVQENGNVVEGTFTMKLVEIE